MRSNPALEHIHSSLNTYNSGSGRVTIDTVVQKAFVTLGLVTIFALGTWYYAGSLIEAQDSQALNTLYGATGVMSLAAVALSFWISLSRSVLTPVILAFCAIEGVVIGAFSKIAELQAGLGAPMGAIAGTLVAFGVTLGFYKFIGGAISSRFMRITGMLVTGFVILSLVDFALHFFSADLGINGFGPMGFLFSLLGFGIAIAMLLSDFRMIEDAVQYGAPEKESWRLAFGLTVTLIWLYINLLRMIVSLKNLADG